MRLIIRIELKKIAVGKLLSDGLDDTGVDVV